MDGRHWKFSHRENLTKSYPTSPKTGLGTPKILSGVHPGKQDDPWTDIEVQGGSYVPTLSLRINHESLRDFYSENEWFAQRFVGRNKPITSNVLPASWTAEALSLEYEPSTSYKRKNKSRGRKSRSLPLTESFTTLTISDGSRAMPDILEQDDWFVRRYMSARIQDRATRYVRGVNWSSTNLPTGFTEPGSRRTQSGRRAANENNKGSSRRVKFGPVQTLGDGQGYGGGVQAQRGYERGFPTEEELARERRELEGNAEEVLSRVGGTPSLDGWEVEVGRWAQAIASMGQCGSFDWQRPGKVGDLVGAIPKPALLLSRQMRLLYGNPEGQRLLGMPLTRVIREGRQLREFVTPLRRSDGYMHDGFEDVSSPMEATCVTNIFAGIKGMDVVVRNFQGESEKYILTMSKARDKGGDIAYLAVFHKLTPEYVPQASPRPSSSRTGHSSSESNTLLEEQVDSSNVDPDIGDQTYFRSHVMSSKYQGWKR